MARVRPVDLVDHDDRLEADLERLADHELGLRHRSFRRIDQHDRRIDHRQDALDLAAEIGVAGGVDDVDAVVLPVDRGRLGEDGDAALLLEVVRVHRAFGDALVLAERAGLFQKLVDQRGLAMVDVRDDRDIAKVHDASRESRAGRRCGRPMLGGLIQGFSQMRKGDAFVASSLNSPCCDTAIRHLPA